MYLDIDREIIYNNYNEYYDQFIAMKKKINKNIFNCKYCNKIFTQKSNYYRHKKKYCKNINLTNKILELEEKLDTIIQSQDNLNNDIIINKYGNENIDNITLNEWKSILNKRYMAVPELIKKIHIDIEENRNIYIPSEKGKYVKVFDGKIWNYNDMKQMLDILVNDNSNRMYDFINEPSNDIKKDLYDKVNNLIDELEYKNKVRDNCKEKIRLLLLNNNKLIKQNFKDINN
jgi:hypothetical protein